MFFIFIFLFPLFLLMSKNLSIDISISHEQSSSLSTTKLKQEWNSFHLKKIGTLENEIAINYQKFIITKRTDHSNGDNTTPNNNIRNSFHNASEIL